MKYLSISYKILSVGVVFKMTNFMHADTVIYFNMIVNIEVISISITLQNYYFFLVVEIIMF